MTLVDMMRSGASNDEGRVSCFTNDGNPTNHLVVCLSEVTSTAPASDPLNTTHNHLTGIVHLTPSFLRASSPGEREAMGLIQGYG